ncbi:MAG: TatD family hydrolase [Nanoarchaeota archaeon]
MKSSFIDIHCHLEMLPHTAEVIERAKKASVNTILTQGVNPETNRAALVLADKYPEVKACLGIYPIDALKMSDKEIDTEIAFIIKNKKRIIAIGEVGMDFKEDEKEHERQKKIFTKMIELSLELNIPVIVHSRKAELECIELLESLKVKKVIMHCFCGKWNLIQRIQKNGWFLTVPTSVTKAEQFQRVASEITFAQLFCETDAPFLHPEKKWPNEPALVVESYKKIAELRGMSLNQIAEAVMENYVMFFGKNKA